MKPRHAQLAPREHTGLIIVDVQEAFRPAIDAFDQMAARIGLLAEGFGLLGRPVLVTEQYPEKLGETVAEVAERLPAGVTPLPKTRFSGWGVPRVERAVIDAGCRTWVICGLETHICVAQTALDLLHAGYCAQVALDAVSSRTARDRDIGIRKMTDAGVGATCAESVLFEMLVDARADEFKAISRLVR